jgi:predicted nucleic acid-binding protein
LKIGIDTSVLIASVKKSGEKFHASAIELSDVIKDFNHVGITSSLVLIELSGALATTTMPVEKIYETELSLQNSFNLEILSYENYVDKAVDLMIEFRSLKRMLKIGAADFHHLSTSIKEGSKIFVTVDEHHLLKSESRQAFRKYINILNPSETLQELKK